MTRESGSRCPTPNTTLPGGRGRRGEPQAPGDPLHVAYVFSEERGKCWVLGLLIPPSFTQQSQASPETLWPCPDLPPSAFPAGAVQLSSGGPCLWPGLAFSPSPAPLSDHCTQAWQA